MARTKLQQGSSSSWNVFLQLIACVATQKLQLFMLLSIPLFSTSCALIVPWILKALVNTLSEAHHTSPIFISLLLMSYGLSWTIHQLISQMRIILSYQVLERSKRLLTLKTIDHLLALSPRFHTERQTGTLISYLDKAQQGIETIFWSLLIFLLPTILELLVTIFIISWLFGILYGIILVCMVAGYLFMSFRSTTKIKNARNLFNEKSAQASAHLVDSLLNYETIRYFNNQAYEHKQADNLLKQQEEASVTYFVLDTKLQVMQLLIISVGLTTITWLSGNAVYYGKVSLGNFILINGYLMQFILPLNYLSNALYQARKGLQDVQAVIELLHTKPEITYKNFSHRPQVQIQSKTFVFKNVSFSYAPDRPILKNISFSMPSGTSTAIVGPSGSGKTTIAKLLFRFYDVTSGSILINNRDMRDFEQDELHQHLGIVPQDIVLFNQSLYENIAYANPHASEQQVKEAARKACLEPFINALPNGYMTVVGERGIKLSGGEKQRIAIARLLLKAPSLYIFDEATSSLDTATEREIQHNLQTIFSHTTNLIIAHRLSTITHADQIIVLDQGHLVEQGTHEQLLKKNGLYARLWDNQQKNLYTNQKIYPHHFFG